MSNFEIRTQIYLPREQYRKAKQMAQKKRVSFAQVIREALETTLRQEEDRWRDDLISRNLGRFAADPDLTERHDHYIYGE